jgi:hypothetical protein
MKGSGCGLILGGGQLETNSMEEWYKIGFIEIGLGNVIGVGLRLVL